MPTNLRYCETDGLEIQICPRVAAFAQLDAVAAGVKVHLARHRRLVHPLVQLAGQQFGGHLLEIRIAGRQQCVDRRAAARQQLHGKFGQRAPLLGCSEQ